MRKAPDITQVSHRAEPTLSTMAHTRIDPVALRRLAAFKRLGAQA